MFIVVADIPPEGYEFSDQEKVDLEISFAGRDISPLKALRVEKLEFKAQRSGDDVFVVGSAEIYYTFECDRCGKDVEKVGLFDFTEVLESNTLIPPGGERELSREELEISFFEGEGFLIEDILFEQVLLSLPQKKLCADDCKGLCIRCGNDLNLKECGCDRSVTDPRFAILKQLLEKKE